MPRISLLAILSVGLVGCAESTDPTAPPELGPPLFSSAPVVEPINGTPIATCAADIGFDVGFVIDAEQLRHVTEDATGQTHTTRHFQAKGFEGWELAAGSTQADFAAARSSPSDFQVQGGAEMFNVQQDAGGHTVVFIHQGNLVFVDVETGERVIAHHSIRTVPGQETQSFWSCQLVG